MDFESHVIIYQLQISFKLEVLSQNKMTLKTSKELFLRECLSESIFIFSICFSVLAI